MKEIAVAPGAATIRYTIPMPEDSPLRGGKAEEVALGGPVLSTKSGGPSGTRTLDLRIKSPLLFHLSYRPNRQGSDHQAFREPRSVPRWSDRLAR